MRAPLDVLKLYENRCAQLGRAGDPREAPFDRYGERAADALERHRQVGQVVTDLTKPQTMFTVELG